MAYYLCSSPLPLPHLLKTRRMPTIYCLHVFIYTHEASRFPLLETYAISMLSGTRDSHSACLGVKLCLITSSLHLQTSS